MLSRGCREACFTKTERSSLEKILHKGFALFLCCLLGIRLMFTVSMWGQHSEPGCHASLALLSKDRSLLVCTSRPLRASGLGAHGNTLHDGNVPHLQRLFKLCSFSCSWIGNHGRFIHLFQLSLLYQWILNQSNSGNVPEAFYCFLMKAIVIYCI